LGLFIRKVVFPHLSLPSPITGTVSVIYCTARVCFTICANDSGGIAKTTERQTTPGLTATAPKKRRHTPAASSLEVLAVTHRPSPNSIPAFKATTFFPFSTTQTEHPLPAL
jgi:hypothetical protein